MLESRTPAFLHRPDWNAKKAEVWLVMNAVTVSVSLMWLRMRERKKEKCVGREKDRTEYAWIFREYASVSSVCVYMWRIVHVLCECVWVTVSVHWASEWVREGYISTCLCVFACFQLQMLLWMTIKYNLKSLIKSHSVNKKFKKRTICCSFHTNGMFCVYIENWLVLHLLQMFMMTQLLLLLVLQWLVVTIAVLKPLLTIYIYIYILYTHQYHLGEIRRSLLL